MTARALIVGVLLAAGGILAYEFYTGRIGSSVMPPAGSPPPDPETPNAVTGFLPVLGHVESSGQPYVKAHTSSASGLYQFLKATWTAMGGAWGDNPALAFGGLYPSVDEQTAMAAKLTENNAGVLSRAGLAITNATLYAAHFLGPFAAIKVLSAPAGTPMTSLVGSSVITANPFLSRMTVADFSSWLTSKVG